MVGGTHAVVEIRVCSEDHWHTGFYKMKPRSCKILRARAAAARGAGVRPLTEITRRNFFSTAPSRMSSASEKRPAPIARQSACGAQRRKSQCHPHVPNKVFFFFLIRGRCHLSASLASHRPPCDGDCDGPRKALQACKHTIRTVGSPYSPP